MKLEKELGKLSSKYTGLKKRVEQQIPVVLADFNSKILTLNPAINFSAPYEWAIGNAKTAYYRDGKIVIEVDLFHKGKRIDDYSSVPENIREKIAGIFREYERIRPGTEVNTTP